MRVAIALLVCTAGGFFVLSEVHGYAVAYSVAYGAVVSLAVSISATFFWLWRMRATPLALGMGFSWAGTSGVLGWWWLYRHLGKPDLMVEGSLQFLFVAAYLVGGVLHFQVIIRSLGPRSVILLLPPALSAWIALWF